MTKYSIILGFIFLIALTGCQTEGQKAYADLLKEGIVLVENDTIAAKVGTKLLYLYSYSAGVQSIYYKLAHENSAPSVLRYLEEQQFYVGAEDVDGGPSEGVLLFEGLKAGLVRLEFYNPYYNEMEYSQAYPEHASSDRAIIEFYKTFTDSVALHHWTDAQYANYYDNWRKLPEEARTEAFNSLLEKYEFVSATVDTTQKTKIMQSLAKRYALREAEETRTVLDSLFNLPRVDGMERWQAVLKERKENLSLHENLKTTVCYVKIED
ncbi:MAG: Unknown protein [uncultured Aureispira sp.]|uniref:Lipoprotein n=1 Tax=uncultured Aureispira sp. TaxID=1331704 RepID=A0A6S6UK10_9BACT|nr:MAG: Unknown protein [uncultured Aureispira sp.]